MSVLRSPSIGVVLGSLALLVAVAAGGIALANSSGSSAVSHGTVEVTGQATVEAKPDTLTVDLTVSVIAASSAAALTSTDAKMRATENVFRSAGIPAKDLSTTNVSVSQNINSQGRPAGYLASEDLTVTIHQLALAGTVLARAVSAVGNDLAINDTSYSLSDQSAPLDTARAQAMANARRSASVLARAVGERLGSVVRITDQSSTTPITFGVVPGAERSAASAVPLQPGQQPVRASVDVVFSLQA